jgi:DNA-binding NarL/FixJ family response regulator
MTTLPASTPLVAVVDRVGFVPLTPREREVLTLLADRWTDQEIADELCISYRTVTTHVSHIFDKLGITSRRSVRSLVRGASPNGVDNRSWPIP